MLNTWDVLPIFLDYGCCPHFFLPFISSFFCKCVHFDVYSNRVPVWNWLHSFLYHLIYNFWKPFFFSVKLTLELLAWPVSLRFRGRFKIDQNQTPWRVIRISVHVEFLFWFIYLREKVSQLYYLVLMWDNCLVAIFSKEKKESFGLLS